jgi:nucleotide-binding universal stress UspA family protein
MVDPQAQLAPEAYLAGMIERIASVYPAPVRSSVQSGYVRAAHGLLRHAKNVGADLIVMATHGYGPLKRLWIGSTADAVARRSRIPTLLIRPAAEGAVDLRREPDFRHILVPLDGSAASESILEHSIALGKTSKGGSAEFTLIEVVLPILGFGAEYLPMGGPLEGDVLQQRRDRILKYLERVAAPLRGRGLQVETSAPIEFFAPEAILDYATTHGVDLITITTHGLGGALRLLLGSVADKVVRGARSPVLLYRPPGR